MAQAQDAPKRRRSPPGAYFPRAEAVPIFLDDNDLPQQPLCVAPIFNPEHSSQPIGEFDKDANTLNYGDDADQEHVPPRPKDFSDSYLFPTLTRNERLRLTMLWYYTSHMLEDKQLMRSLHSMVDMIQKFMGWEYAILGFLDEATFTRMVTVNMSVATIPRREATCAHTVNQSIGKVFTVTNMHEDWRFGQSPAVKYGGLESYAGTQLRLKTDSGEEVALGSLCIASPMKRETLKPDQKASLIRFADMLMSEIVSSNRQWRFRQRQHMTDLLVSLQSHSESDDFKTFTIDTIRRIYPNAHVTVQDSSDDLIEVHGRSPIKVSEAKAGLWEDTEAIDFAIRAHNFEHYRPKQSVRAIIARCGMLPKFLVVASEDTHLVFDDYDAWFVERCALLLADVLQHRYLQEVLRAKEAFMRGITHQLRTPIHGVLASTELLAEELTARGVIRRSSIGTTNDKMGACPSSYISAIRNSGQELMSTVNNVLKLNSWAEKTMAQPKATMYDLFRLESDILEEILFIVPEERLRNVSIVFDNQLSTEQCMISIDATLFKECIQSLLLNALQATEHGTVALTLSAVQESSVLQVDITDTGRGINPADHQRIFEAYEKASLHTPGVGLGLTLASKTAEVLRGAITLESSAEGYGSHFRVCFRHVVLMPREECANKRSSKFKNLPQSYFQVPASEPTHMLKHLARYLESSGLQPSPHPEGALIIADSALTDTTALLSRLVQGAVAICIFSSVEQAKIWKNHVPNLKMVPAIGPFYSNRLNEILGQANKMFEDILDETTISLPEHSKPTIPTRDSDTSTTTVQSLYDNGDMPNGTHTPNGTSTLPYPSLTTRRSRVTRALLVDDNVINLRIFRLYCEKRGIPYLLATDGEEAITQYNAALNSSQPIDLILMDLQMPRCDGLTATQEIRNVEVKGVRDPSVVFIITGQDSAADRTKGFEAGANEFLVKPASLKTLDGNIKRYFSKHMLQTA